MENWNTDKQIKLNKHTQWIPPEDTAPWLWFFIKQKSLHLIAEF